MTSCLCMSFHCSHYFINPKSKTMFKMANTYCYLLSVLLCLGGRSHEAYSSSLVCHSFCPHAELRVGRKPSAETCNTCSTRCCLGIELIDFWFQCFVTFNGIAGLAQHCGTSLKIKLSTIVLFTAFKTILYSR